MNDGDAVNPPIGEQAEPPKPDYGAWYAPPTASMTPPAPRRKRRRLVVIIGVVMALVAGSLAAAYLLTRPAKIKYPKAWDPRVLEYVHFVEQDRHHTFKHPIQVDFLSDADFKKKVTTPESTLSKDDRTSLENETATLRSLGLVDANFDPLKTANELQSGDVVGLYEPKTKRISVRGQDVSLLARPTLVHELTHALQDQYFDLQGHEKQYEKQNNETGDGYHAIVEGDAVRVENDYRESLSQSDQTALAKLESDQQDQANKDVADVPKILQAFQEFPYDAGTGLVMLQKARTGAASVDDLFTSPPVSTEQLVDPWRYYAGDKPTTVTKPPAPNGDKVLDDGVFGDLAIYLVLAERIDVKEALRAADGWGGDHYILYRDGNRSCTRVDYVGDSNDDVTRLHKALDEWIAAGPKDAASVGLNGAGLRLTSCSTDGKVSTRDTSTQALGLITLRTRLAVDFVSKGANSHLAECAAHDLVDQFSLEALQADSVTPADREKIQQIVASCR